MPSLPPRLEPAVVEARRLARSDPFLIAGAIAYNVVFALIPLIFAAVAALSMISLGDDVLAWLAGVISQGAPADVGQLVDSTIQETEVFIGSMGPVVLVGSLLVALWSGSRAIYAIQKALRLTEGVQDQRRAYWAARSIGILLTLGAGVALIVAYVVLLLGGWVVEVLREAGLSVGQLTTTSTLVIAAWLVAVLFAVYRWGIAVPIRKPLISAGVTATLLVGATWLGAVMVPSIGGGTAAALGSLGVILVWSYAVGFIVIVTPSVVSAVAAIVRGPDS
jgi:uncharacterized BrkB/YihY/UPF0761 family membrane protein